MIPARKTAWFQRWFGGNAEARIKGAFESVRIRGLDHLRAASADGPVLVVTNHTAWWDPLVAIYVSTRVLDCDAYAMMDAKNLQALPFFAKVGAFGVDLADPRDGARAIRYAAKLLDRSPRLVWIFAQGREVPVTVRPLGFRAGSGEIARVARRAVVVPGAIRYEMGGTARPTLWISFGEPVDPGGRGADPRSARELHEARVTGELDRIESAVVRAASATSDAPETDGFERVYARPREAFFELATRTLAWWTRPKALVR